MSNSTKLQWPSTWKFADTYSVSADDDLELLRAWRDGDKFSGSQFYKRHAPAISRFFRNKLTCAEDAADLLHDTFLALQKRLQGPAHTDLEVRTPKSYLYGIAHNVLRGQLREKYKRHNEELDFSVVCVKELAPAGMSTLLLQRRDLQIFVDGLRAIPLDDQVILESKYFDCLSIREIADLLGISETAIPGRLQRAKVRLREQIERLATQVPDISVPEPSDDELERWAGEIRRLMGWTGINEP